MKRQFDILAHLLLMAALAIGGIAFFRSRISSQDQFLVILAMVFFYLAWGLVYHLGRRDLTKKVYLEYLLISGIASVAGVLIFIL